METKTVTQVRIYKLILNPMEGKAESERIAAFSTSKEKLENFIQQEKVESYVDGRWRKTFRQGGILEWFNPSRWMGADLIEDEWVDEDFYYSTLEGMANFIK